ncbi:MAG: hypothetical protein DYG98_02330 [Haliscomenobacteraceae bacterium CHB4]|nr:hypothetical protein [Saprospiraceae bacterium]MCE7921869.1 hypothetical protein [Haliscomenobacteraceae bacterium CHB4]
MKRILIWVLILQFATGHNLLAEVVRMPLLLDHFRAHKTEAQDLSFARFLWQHYWKISHSHSDNSHAQLPLHCSHGIMAESMLPYPPEVVFCPTIIASESSNRPVSDESFSPGEFSHSLLRPPIA